MECSWCNGGVLENHEACIPKIAFEEWAKQSPWAKQIMDDEILEDAMEAAFNGGWTLRRAQQG